METIVSDYSIAPAEPFLHCFLCGADRRGCTYDTSVVLEVQEDTVGALPGLGLADDDGGVDLLSELGLSLLDGGHAV